MNWSNQPDPARLLAPGSADGPTPARFSAGTAPSLMVAVLTAAGIAYPFFVGFLSGLVPAPAWVALALGLTAARLLLLRRGPTARMLAPPLMAVAIACLALSALSAELAARAYPALMSLGFAAAFGISLLNPPCLIEVLARLSPRATPPTARARQYMRRVTVMWFLFLLVNTSLCLGTALWASPAFWAFYTGVVSYALMGILFVGEWLVRRRIQGRDTAE